MIGTVLTHCNPSHHHKKCEGVSDVLFSIIISIESIFVLSQVGKAMATSLPTEYQNQMIHAIDKVAIVNFVLEIKRTPEDIKQGIISRRNELTSIVKHEGDNYNVPELLLLCGILVDRNDEHRKLPDTEEWAYKFIRRSLEGYQQNKDWFGFSNAWSFCNYYLHKYDIDFAQSCEYVIINNLQIVADTAPYFMQDLVETLSSGVAVNRRNDPLFYAQFNKSLFKLYKRFVERINTFGKGWDDVPSWASVAKNILNSKIHNNEEQLDIIDLHNLAINLGEQLVLEDSSELLELFLAYGELLDDENSVYQYVKVLEDIVHSDKPENYLNLLHRTFQAIKKDMSYWEKKPTLREYIDEGTTSLTEKMSDEKVNKLLELKNQ